MTETTYPFTLFGPPHLTVLFLTVAIPVALCLWARRVKKATRPIAIGIASILLLNKLAVFTFACIYNTVPWLERLPMHLCDWVTFIAAAALLLRKQTLYELTYFWGLAGTLQATVTPDLPYGFPHFYFFTFNISHSGILIAAAFLTFGMQFRPYPFSILRAFLWIQLYAAVTILVNLATDQNYGYLCDKPQSATLLDHLGPWPWYILSLELMALVFFTIYYLPFWLYDLYKRKMIG
ncbi:MAG: TIGR02206 family membrane protein [Verrucomicrobiota bacterium]